MTNNNIIILTITLAICSTLGGYVLIKFVKKYTPSPTNALVRRHGDIELQTYIEPTQPQQVYNPDFDLTAFQFPTIERIQTPSSYRIPSYWSGNPPSYHTEDRFYILSYLEESINPDFILSLFLLLGFILMFILIIRLLLLFINIFPRIMHWYYS